MQVLFFKTSWCKVCESIQGLYYWFPKHYNNIKFIMVPLDNRDDLVKRFKIKEYPTFIIFKNKIEVYRQETGNLADLKNAIDKFNT